MIVINRTEVYSGVIRPRPEGGRPRPEGGSPRVKVLITRLSTESTVYNYYIARGCFRRMLSKDYLSYQYSLHALLSKTSLSFEVCLYLREKVYYLVQIDASLF